MKKDYLPFATFIVLNWNGSDQTLRAVRSILDQDYPKDCFELIVVDNGSNASQKFKIKNQKFKIIWNKTNLGFAAGNNIGMRQVLKEKKTDIIALVNNDVVLKKNWLRAMVKPFANGQTGISAGVMLFARDRKTIENTGHKLLATGDIVPRARGQNFENWKLSRRSIGIPIGTSEKIGNPPSFDGVMGACAGAACYRVAMLKKIGLFYSDFFANYEDADLSLRAITIGWKCAFVAKAVCYHEHNFSIAKVRNQQFAIRSQSNQLKAYWYNVPLWTGLANLPLIILRETLALFFLITTFQLGLFNIFLRARYKFLADLPTTLKRRAKTQKSKQDNVAWHYLSHQSWLPIELFDQLKKVLTKKVSL